MKLSTWIIILGIIGLIILFGWYMMSMPGKSYTGPLPELSESEKKLQEALKAHINKVAVNIGERNMWHLSKLNEAADYIQKTWEAQGFTVKKHVYQVENKDFYNLYIDIPGTNLKDEMIIVGAHYDSVYASPGANDNGTGVASILELSNFFKDKKQKRTLRFVAFTNEEPPMYFSKFMGSIEFVKSILTEKNKIKAMISIETIGCYDDKPNSQIYPFFFKLWYPDKGNFIAFISNMYSRKLVRRTLGVFRKTTKFPSEGIAAPSFIPGIAWSDQWAFWRYGIPGIMITDTALFRYRYYHTDQDTPDKINYDGFTRVVLGIEKVIEDLVNH